MASQLELLAEAHRRGILPADKIPLFEEAQRRGLIKGSVPASPSGTDRSGWSEATRKGYDDYQASRTPEMPQDGSALLAANSASLGFGDEISAGIKAGAGAIYDFAQGKTPEFSRRYDEAWGAEQARLDNARKNAWFGGVPADIAGGFALGPGKAAINATAPSIQTLREAASQSAKVGAAYGGAAGVGFDDSGTLEGRAGSGATGAAAGYAFGRAIPNAIHYGGQLRENLITRPIENLRNRVSQQAMNAANDFNAAGINPDNVFPPALVQGGPVEGVAQNLAGTVFGGSIREGARRSIDDVERGIANQMAAAGGRQTPAEAGADVQRVLRDALETRTIPKEQIERMTPAELQDVSGVAPGPKYDPPPPIVDPVQPRHVRPQTADDVLRAAEMEVPEQLPLYPPERRPQYPQEATPKYKNPTFDEIQVPPALKSQREQHISTFKEVAARHDKLIEGEAKILKEIDAIHQTAGVEGSRVLGDQLRVTVNGNEYRWNGRVLLPPRTAPRPDLAMPYQQEPQRRGVFDMLRGRKPQAVPEQPPVEQALPQINVSEDQAMALQRLASLQKVVTDRSRVIDELAFLARNARAAIDDIDNQIVKTRSQGLADEAIKRRAAEDARVSEANQNLPWRRAEAERIARELTEQDRRIAQEQANAIRAKQVEQARAAASKNADEIAANRTAQMRREAEAEARRQTSARQAQSDAEHAAELARRRAQAEQDFELGNTGQSFTTQLDAAYEQVARNAPAIQRNPLGSKSEPGMTRTAQLLDEFGHEARRAMKLKGYRGGQPFDDDGGIRQDLMAYLNEHLGHEVGGRLKAYSDARAGGKFVPSVQGLRDMRTAIGKQIEVARKARAMGETRTADEAMLARLYDAMSQDIQTFLRAAGPDGELAARQMLQVDAEYKRFLRDLRIPLSKVFGEKTSPEQAIASLRRAMRADGGDVRLLERFYTVAGNQGDRLRTTNSLLSNMLDEGLEGFLRQWRDISPEARRIMFAGDAKAYGESLDRLARAGGHLERYIRSARRGGTLRATVTNPGNIMAVMAGFLNIPTAMLGVMGSTATSRMLSSRWFSNWIRNAPQRVRNQRQWRSHVARFRAIAQEQFGLNDALGAQLEASILGSGEQEQIRIPSVVPRHKTRQDVIERLQYEAE